MRRRAAMAAEAAVDGSIDLNPRLHRHRLGRQLRLLDVLREKDTTDLQIPSRGKKPHELEFALPLESILSDHLTTEVPDRSAQFSALYAAGREPPLMDGALLPKCAQGGRKKQPKNPRASCEEEWRIHIIRRGISLASYPLLTDFLPFRTEMERFFPRD